MEKKLKELDKLRCHDRECLPGEKHYDGCDVDECPNCHGQLISCDCPEELAPKDGWWPALNEKIPYGSETRIQWVKIKHWHEILDNNRHTL